MVNGHLPAVLFYGLYSHFWNRLLVRNETQFFKATANWTALSSVFLHNSIVDAEFRAKNGPPRPALQRGQHKNVAHWITRSRFACHVGPLALERVIIFASIIVL